MQEANKGLWDKVKNAVVGVIKTILELKDMLLNVLAKAASVIGKIIKDPIGFLGNLIAGIKGGLQAFLGEIAKHMKKGVVGWLLGAMQSAGLELPAKFAASQIVTKEQIAKTQFPDSDVIGARRKDWTLKWQEIMA